MNDFLKSITKIAEFEQTVKAAEMGGGPVALFGTGRVHKALLLAMLKNTGHDILVVCADATEAARIAESVYPLIGECIYLPAADYIFYDAEGVSREWNHKRLSALYEIKNGKRGRIIVAELEGLCQFTMPKERFISLCYTFKTGDTADMDDLCEKLVKSGYKPAHAIEGMGQFSRRGGILDIFSPNMREPVRIEFFGDEIDSLRSFNLITQRATSNLKKLTIIPACEILPDYETMEQEISRLLKLKIPEGLRTRLKNDLSRTEEGINFGGIDRYVRALSKKVTPLDFLSEDCIVVINESINIKERERGRFFQQSEDVKTLLEREMIHGSLAPFYLRFDETISKLNKSRVIMCDAFIPSSYPLPQKQLLGITAKQMPSMVINEQTVKSLSDYVKSGYKTIYALPDSAGVSRAFQELHDAGVPAVVDSECENEVISGVVTIIKKSLTEGFEFPGEKVCVLCAPSIKRYAKSKKSKKRAGGDAKRLKSYTELTTGDYVVHKNYGVGRYDGINSMTVQGVTKDYIKISFAGTDVLYVPANQLDLISKYQSSDVDRKVKLSKMGSAEWHKTKSRAKGAAADMAKKLIALYKQRASATRPPFSPDTEWQRDFEAKFEYEETADQLRCAHEIKKDMEKPYPMDRLLCGDVGFGKTEVAMRAVFKCVSDGRQAAVLVPTTVLASQHFATMVKRFEGVPANVAMLSRFVSPKKQKEILRAIKDGLIDIVIGTHRLLQNDIAFKNLGLVVIDEEQRFGVGHKEKLKEMTKTVDVLTITATPIPRTLNMALSGIRDMSILEEPPSGRYPVSTYVLEHNWEIVADAIKRELRRGGQVYYLKNRIDAIDRTATKIKELIPEASVAVGHGQMTEQQLSPVLMDFYNNATQVLCCTTIIESGVDIPNVNTIIIEDADRLGLSQLHQIRGRVGRSGVHAFAYLTFRKDKVINEIAQKRLSAIRENTEFGSGFKIAMRDLEIRGAGEILGAEQSGHLQAVGYDLYVEMLNEAVLKEQGRSLEKKTECVVDVFIDSHIPDSYIPSPQTRIEIYQKIASVSNYEDASDVTDELIDRFGDIPQSAQNLIDIALIRNLAQNVGIREITQKGKDVHLIFEEADLKVISTILSMTEYKNKVVFKASQQPVLVFLNCGKNKALPLKEFLQKLSKLCE